MKIELASMWKLLKSIFFLLDAELAHHLAMDLLVFSLKIPVISQLLKRSFKFESDLLHTEISGMKATNPIGLAAGFDKDGNWLNALMLLGFGHIELGTVTKRPQSGNPKPRLFRLIKDRSIINRMGFNNQGVDALVDRLKKFNKPDGLILGGNIGKNKESQDDQIIQDYLYCFTALFDFVDYFTINVSSPNTPGLRALQDKEPLNALLSAVQLENKKHLNRKPLFLKIAPDLSEEALDDILKVVQANDFSGIIVSNTTIDRPDFLIEKEIAKESGGLSGEALHVKSLHALQHLKSKAEPKLILIGVGGIMNEAAAIDRLKAGANWIQIYTGMIYEGPWFIKKIKQELIKTKAYQRN